MTALDAHAGAATIAARYVGQSVARLEDPRLLTGRGRYVANLTPAGAGHVADEKPVLDFETAAAGDPVHPELGSNLSSSIAGGLEYTARYKAPPVTYSNAAHACTCEVDVATGAVRLLRYAVSEDCGVMINPMVVKGQIAGGVVQGIGGALLEEAAYDGDGNPLATTFADYLVPSAAEVPTIEYGHVVTPSDTPGGHKGTGEGGAIGSVPCVFNAVADALAPLGVRLTDGPLSPDRVRAAIAAAVR